MRSAPRLWRREEWSKVLADVYDELLLDLYYSEDDRLDFIEVATGRCRVTLDGVTLIPGSVSDVVRDLERHGFEVRRVESGRVIEGKGVELFTPSSEEGAEIKGVAVRAVDAGELGIEFFGSPGGSSVQDWSVEPRIGVAGVRLGQGRSEIRRRMGEGAGFPLSADKALDHYWAEGLYVIFDAAERVCEIVAVEPAKPRVCGVEPLRMTYSEAYEALAAAGCRMTTGPAEIWLPDLDISVRWTRIDDAAPAVAVAMRRT